jgi:N12 class adenine-specific DNA methylase
VDVALFALSSPLSKGALLADEVGLGKTIETGLAITQRWAERKRHILLIVPASLRKQWSQELFDKFSTAVVDPRKRLLQRGPEEGGGVALPGRADRDHVLRICGCQG